MKKTIITLSVIALALSSTAQSHENDYLIVAGLLGLGLALGDGHTSFGIHYSNGYYNYRGHRYNNRSAYLRAVENYERQHRYYPRRTISISNHYYSRNINYSRNNSYYRDNSNSRSNSNDQSRTRYNSRSSGDSDSRSTRINRSASRN